MNIRKTIAFAAWRTQKATKSFVAEIKHEMQQIEEDRKVKQDADRRQLEMINGLRLAAKQPPFATLKEAEAEMVRQAESLGVKLD